VKLVSKFASSTVDPSLKGAWFQALSLKSETPVSSLCFSQRQLALLHHGKHLAEHTTPRKDLHATRGGASKSREAYKNDAPLAYYHQGFIVQQPHPIPTPSSAGAYHLLTIVRWFLFYLISRLFKSLFTTTEATTLIAA
jgi:hypothetical protein